MAADVPMIFPSTSPMASMKMGNLPASHGRSNEVATLTKYDGSVRSSRSWKQHEVGDHLPMGPFTSTHWPILIGLDQEWRVPGEYMGIQHQVQFVVMNSSVDDKVDGT